MVVQDPVPDEQQADGDEGRTVLCGAGADGGQDLLADADDADRVRRGALRGWQVGVNGGGAELTPRPLS